MTPPNTAYINFRQIKAARALLDWSQDDLAAATELAVATIRKIESGSLSPRHSTIATIRAILESQRIEFMPSSGVRLRDNDISTIEGDDSYVQLSEDMIQTMRHNQGDILFLYADHRVDTEAEDLATQKLWKTCNNWRLIIEENNTHLYFPLDKYRVLPKKFFKRNFQVIYGNKVALATEVDHTTNTTKKIIVIESPAVAEAHRHLFNFIWESCRKPTFTTASVVYE
jgi:predicted transcriptional regulator